MKNKKLVYALAVAFAMVFSFAFLTQNVVFAADGDGYPWPDLTSGP